MDTPQKRHYKPRSDRLEGMAPEILDVEGAARLLGVSKRTIYNLAERKKIPAAKVGREWRFSRKRLIEWVSGGPGPAPVASTGEPQTLEELLRGASVRAAPKRG